MKFTSALTLASVVLPNALATPAEEISCSQYASTATNIITSPPLVQPEDIAVDGSGDIFVVDAARKEVIRVDGADRSSSVIMGQEYLTAPIGIAISPSHADLYIGDNGNGTATIWQIPCQTRNQNTCVKYYGTPLNITLGTNVHPEGLEMDLDDHLYIADHNGHRVLKRDVTTGVVSVVLDASTMGDQAPANPFTPHDIGIDQNTNELFVTDDSNDDIWSLKCLETSITGFSCDVYAGVANKLELESDGSDITTPSGIQCDLQGDLYVTGKIKGIVARVQGNTSTAMLAEGTLLAPVALGYDSRPTSKSIYISDDAVPTDTTDQGLYELSCLTFTCVSLTTDLVPNLLGNICPNTNVGGTCTLACADGYASLNSTVSCTAEGWDLNRVACSQTSGGGGSGGGSGGTTVAPSSDGGVIAGVIIAVLVVLGVGAFLFIRYRQGKLIVKKSSDYGFGSAGV